MVRINSVALAGLAAVGAVARPAQQHARRSGTCMTSDEAAFVAANYGTLIANYTSALADQVLAPNFTDYSESVNTLINTCPQGAAAVSLPLLSPTFTSRAMFEIGQGQQPSINFEQLNIWPACDTVIIRWMTNNTAPIADPKPVVGLISMEVVPNTNATAAVTYPWLIDYVYSEFDAGAWLQNLEEAGICGTAPGPCDSQQVPQQPNSTTTANTTVIASTTSGSSSSPVTLTATSTAIVTPSSPAASSSTASPVGASSSASLVASTSVGQGGVVVTTVTSVAVATSTSTVKVVVGANGTVEEVPCDDE